MTDAAALDPIVRMTWRIFDVVDDVARAHDLSPTLLRLLAILRGREPEMLDIARHLGLDKSSVSGLVARAETRGLVERAPSTVDRRRVAVRLTDDGRALARRAESEVYGRLGAFLAPLGAAERGALVAAAERLAPGG